MSHYTTDNPSDEWNRGDRRSTDWQRSARHGFDTAAYRLRRLPRTGWWMFGAGLLIGLILG